MVKRMIQFCYTMEYPSHRISGDKPGRELQAHTNAEMYALAEKYQMTALKNFAKSTFTGNLESSYWKNLHAAKPDDRLDLPSLVNLVYDGTPESDRGLRDLIVSYFQKTWDKWIDRAIPKRIILEHPDLGFDIINCKPLTIQSPPKPLCNKKCGRCEALKRTTDNWKALRVTCGNCGWNENL